MVGVGRIAPMTSRAALPPIEQHRKKMSGWTAAASISLLAAVTILMFSNGGLSLSLERQVPALLLVGELLAVVLLTAATWATARHRPRVSVALAAMGLAILVPAWAAWPSLPAAARAAVLALSPLSVPGAAAVAMGWSTDRGSPSRLQVAYLLASAGGATHLIAYNPFADPGCLITCVAVDPVAAGILRTSSAVAITAFLTMAAAGVASLAILRTTPAPGPNFIIASVIASLLIVATAWALRWARSGEPSHSELLLLLPFVASALPSLAVLGAVIQTWRTRRSIERLVSQLAGSGAALKDLGGTVREVQFAMPNGEGWVNSMGNPIPQSATAPNYVVVSDRAGSIVRLLLAPGKEAHEVMEALTPASRLALKNAQLAAATRSRVAEVQASQRRVVAASDAERRRIERDLHDGAQQRLISAVFQMKMAPTWRPQDAAALARAQRLVGAALGHLRRLAHGVFPSVLTSDGLWVALDELVRASAIPTTLEVSGEDQDIDPHTAMAAYAIAVAALDRAGSVAGVARVAGRRQSKALEITVELPIEIDVDSKPDFVDVGDRVGAVGGSLSVLSAGGVTTVKAVMPCGL